MRIGISASHLGKLGIAVWFTAMVVVSSGLLAKHVVALPEPHSQQLSLGLGKLRNAAEQHRWLAVHALYSDCRCSHRIADYLTRGQRPSDWSEIVLWVGDEPAPASLTSRFDVRSVTSQDLSSLGIEAAPSFVVVDPEGTIRYAGGYTDRKQGPVIEDLPIMHATRNDKVVPSLPLFGCAVSDRLKNELSLLPIR